MPGAGGSSAERARGRGVPILPLVAFAVAALGLLLAVAVFLLPGVLSDGLIETDGYLRLVRVERLWDTWHWFDSTLPRVNAPYGDTLHWTRPYDVVILIGAAPLLAFLPAKAALHASAVASTPVLLVLACLLAVWAVRPLVPTRARLLAMLVLFSQAGILMVSLPGRADHHTLIILLFVLAMGGMLRTLVSGGTLPGSDARAVAAGPQRNDAGARVRVGFLAGFALAMGLWVSTEFLVVWAAVLVALALAWVAVGGVGVAERARSVLAWTTAATVFCLLIERGWPGFLTLEYDKISIAHAGVAVLGALAWGAILALSRRWAATGGAGGGPTLSRRLAVVAVTGVVAASAIALLFPGFLGGPWADLPAEQRRFWFELVREYQPLLPTSGGLGSFIVFVAPVIVGAGFAVLRTIRSWGEDTWCGWLLVTCMLAFYLPLCIRSLRFAPPAEVPATFALVAALSSLYGAIDHRFPPPLSAALQTVSTLAVLLGFVVVGGLLTPPTPLTASPSAAECRLDRLAQFLERPDGMGSRPRIIFAHQDYSPELLYRTRHSVVATSFHRNVAAVWEVRDVLRGADEERSHEALQRRGADLILICPQARGGYFRPDPGQGQRQGASLYARLVRGDLPTWLRRVPVDVPGTEGFLLFEVVD